jgi:hypothetical protein
VSPDAKAHQEAAQNALDGCCGLGHKDFMVTKRYFNGIIWDIIVNLKEFNSGDLMIILSIVSSLWLFNIAYCR